MPEPLLSIGDAAERLGIPVTTLRGWSNRGIIPTVKTPTGHRRFRAEDVDRIVADMTPMASAPPNDREENEE